jgi:truncated hemoglobin YjbI
MEAAMEEVNIPSDTKPALMQFFEHVAKFLINASDDGAS